MTVVGVSDCYWMGSLLGAGVMGLELLLEFWGLSWISCLASFGLMSFSTRVEGRRHPGVF